MDSRKTPFTPEHQRLEEARTRTVYWRKWGPYLSDRQWGTVREDYSENGTAWEYFPHDHARSRAYRWGEDGLLGISDNHQRLCFALALWNEKDPILKERLFGLTGNEGNHGEDVKEYYFYLDNTPTHSYMKALYKYPQSEFPYTQLVAENRRRGKRDPEYELMDTGVFDQDRYFDVFTEYAKAGVEDILIRITVINRGPHFAPLHLLPTLWFRNTWTWNDSAKPVLTLQPSSPFPVVQANHLTLPPMYLIGENAQGALFTENETNVERLFGVPNLSPYVKDAIHRYVIHNEKSAVNPAQQGTKAVMEYRRTLAPGETWEVNLRLSTTPPNRNTLGAAFNAIMEQRKSEADAFYAHPAAQNLGPDGANVQRQALAGMLWSKQYYHYVIKDWLEGDPAQPPPPPGRKQGRNHEWEHFYSDDILSMPDKWEYPWFAAWDLAFHCIPLALIDPDFAKQQLVLLTREWYMHPNGQLPAYEWAFGDVNPPVHAWAAWRVYKIEKKMRGQGDIFFLERVFQKLLINFTWWVNRKDSEGMNIFQGGFLGLDNIGVFDRSQPLPTGGHLEQADGTSWMAMYCLNLMKIAIELAHSDPIYEDIASKFFVHFLYISNAMNHMGGHGKDGTSLWDDPDKFFYDQLHLPNNKNIPLRIYSMVGLIPLFAIETLELASLMKLPAFNRRINWFLTHRPELSMNVTCKSEQGFCERRILSIVTPDQLRDILRRLLDEQEFLSPHGIRALSRYHRDHPYQFYVDGMDHRIDYEPAESTSGLFGANSNWRGPVWMPVNMLIIESLQKFHHYLGDDYKVECPTGSGRMMNLWEVSMELTHRLVSLFTRDAQGRRPVFGGTEKFQSDPQWKDYLLFYECFHGDNGAGIGASHQTGWSGLIAKLLQQCGDYCRHPPKNLEYPADPNMAKKPS